MPKPSGASPADRSAFVLAPEAPYPAVGGGALRTASLLEYLRPRYRVDVATFREPGRPDPRSGFPSDIRAHVIDLPAHSRTPVARAVRNLARACRSVPPLIDRFSGFEAAVRSAVAGRRFALGVIEHFWCAPYADVLRPVCDRLVLNLHNIESVLARRQAEAARGPVRLLAGHFATCYTGLERRWLPIFDDILVTSEVDAERLGQGIVYPNAIPELRLPQRDNREEIVFSGNLEYEPNQTAVRWFREAIWPILRVRRPELTWRLIGRNEHAVTQAIDGDSRIELSGPVNDAVQEIARARAAVVPLLSGSGTRVKIIEAWAAGVPVISTTVGAEGLPAIPDKHLRIADKPEEFANVVLEVLDSEPLRKKLAANGRQLYEERLTWRAAWRSLERTGF